MALQGKQILSGLSLQGFLLMQNLRQKAPYLKTRCFFIVAFSGNKPSAVLVE